MGKPSWQDELPLFLIVVLEPIEMWVTDFLRPIPLHEGLEITTKSL